MTVTEAAILIGAIFGTSVVGAIIALRKDRRQAPIERAEAETAQTMSHVEAANVLMAQALALSEVSDERSRLTTEKVKSLDRRVTEQGAEIDGLRRALAAARLSVTILLTAWRSQWPDVPTPTLPLDEFPES